MLTMEVWIENFASQNYFKITKDALLSLNFESARQSDFERPSFGIISKTGTISFVDKDSVVKNNLQWLTTNKKFVIYVFLKNTKTDTYRKVGEYTTNKWRYNQNSNIVEVDFADTLQEWQDRNVDELPVDLTSVTTKDCVTIYTYLRETLKRPLETNGKITYYYLYGLDDISDLDEKTQDILNNTIIKYPILKSGSLWENFEKLCQVCGLHIYSENGSTHCVYGL